MYDSEFNYFRYALNILKSSKSANLALSRLADFFAKVIENLHTVICQSSKNLLI